MNTDPSTIEVSKEDRAAAKITDLERGSYIVRVTRGPGSQTTVQLLHDCTHAIQGVGSSQAGLYEALDSAMHDAGLGMAI